VGGTVGGGVGGGVAGDRSADTRWVEFDDRMGLELPSTATTSQVFRTGAYMLLYQLDGGVGASEVIADVW